MHLTLELVKTLDPRPRYLLAADDVRSHFSQSNVTEKCYLRIVFIVSESLIL